MVCVFGRNRRQAAVGLFALRRLARLIPTLTLRNCFAGATIPCASYT
ncbi:MAG: hypothetical protein IJP90_07570 [Treponema sp.]|nr:hypothetical protein [Treponema sp.]MBR0099562.1 hypothetical protein [Treponema sp.]